MKLNRTSRRIIVLLLIGISITAIFFITGIVMGFWFMFSRSYGSGSSEDEIMAYTFRITVAISLIGLFLMRKIISKYWK